MKFITSRIISPNQVKSLMEIIAEHEAPKVEATEPKAVKTASVEKKIEKVASQKTEPVKTEKTVKAETVKTDKPVTKTAKELTIKKVEASKTVHASKFGRVWKKIKSTAALTGEDRSFLSEYFRKYYPADYVEALIAQY
jgi:hypothetical protein